jgi:signal transduction histidine kinase
MRILALMLFLALVNTIPPRCTAQEMDSLHSALRTAPDDTSFARTAYYLARDHFRSGAPDSAIHYGRLGAARLASSASLGTQHEFWATQLWRIRGMGWFATSRFDSAIVAFQQMYRSAERQPIVKDMGAALSYQGFALRQMGDQRGALEMIQRAMKVLAQIPPGPDLANCYHELGIIQGEAGMLDSAMRAYQEAARLYKEQGNTHHLANTYLSLSETFFEAARWAEADSMQELTSTMMEQMEDPSLFGRWAVTRSRSLLRMSQHAAALPLLDSALIVARELGDLNLEHHTLLLRSMAHTQAGRSEAAFIDQLAAREAHAEDMDLEKVRATEKARSAFEHEKELAVQQARTAKERWQKWGALGMGILAVVLALMVYRSYRAKSATAEALARKNDQIQRAQAELIKSEKQREAEQVRTRIARDIHDEIGATLTKIALLSGVAMRGITEPSEAQRSFERISDHTKRLTRTLSDVVWAVDPERDTRQGMLEHVRDLAQRALGENGIQFQLDLHTDLPDGPIAPAFKRDLHLVFNECFNNILKHAQATNVRVQFHLRHGSFELKVEDDGIGFDTAAATGNGNGTRNMKVRIEQHDGRLTINSTPGKGTLLQAHGPLT